MGILVMRCRCAIVVLALNQGHAETFLEEQSSGSMSMSRRGLTHCVRKTTAPKLSWLIRAGPRCTSFHEPDVGPVEDAGDGEEEEECGADDGEIEVEVADPVAEEAAVVDFEHVVPEGQVIFGVDLRGHFEAASGMCWGINLLESVVEGGEVFVAFGGAEEGGCHLFCGAEAGDVLGQLSGGEIDDGAIVVMREESAE